MAKINTDFFELLSDNEKPDCDMTRRQPETQTQCLAAIVVLLAELVDEAHKANEFDFKSS